MNREHLLAVTDRDFEQRLFDEAERFVNAGLGCTISNFATASTGEGGERPEYANASRCGLR